jgi:hypothetical protein
VLTCMHVATVKYCNHILHSCKHLCVYTSMLLFYVIAVNAPLCGNSCTYPASEAIMLLCVCVFLPLLLYTLMTTVCIVL